MVTYTATKQLAGTEDLTIGLGQVVQPRKSGTKNITKVNVSELNGIYTVNTVAEFNAIDYTKLGNIKIVHIVETNQSFRHDGTQWITYSSGGQFADIGDADGKSVPYLVSTTAINETITVKSGQNSFAIDEIVIADGSELVIENNAVFKVL